MTAESKEGIRSTVRLPLIVKGQVIGTLYLDNIPPGGCTERDLELLVPLGEQLALISENARLHGEMERMVEERTKALEETSALISENARLHGEMERMVEERTKALEETPARPIQSGKLTAVGTLAASVAHELNQSLMVIRGYAQELLGNQLLGTRRSVTAYGGSRRRRPEWRLSSTTSATSRAGPKGGDRSRT